MSKDAKNARWEVGEGMNDGIMDQVERLKDEPGIYDGHVKGQNEVDQKYLKELLDEFCKTVKPPSRWKILRRY